MKTISSGSAKTRKLTLTALFSALIAVMTFVPYVGYIQTAFFSITTLHIPVLVGGLMLGFAGSVTLGTVWGVTCLLNAFLINPIEGAIFLNPLISVVPRILVGVVIGLVGMALERTRLRGVPRSVITAVTGTLTNTVLVLTAIGLFAGDGLFQIGETLKSIYTIVIGVNGVIEMGLAIFLTPVLVIALKKAQKNL